MNKYLIVSNNGIDTQLPNEDFEPNGDFDKIYSEYDAQIVIGEYKADNELNAKFKAHLELKEQGYSTKHIDLIAYQLTN